MENTVLSFLSSLSEAEAKVVWEALSQYVDNTRDADATEDLSKGAADSLLVAEALLEKMDAAMAVLMEGQ